MEPINSTSQILFANRTEAGRLLGERLLSEFANHDALVLGIPRGGVPVALEVARALNAELDVIAAHKIGAPFSEEFAIGAVTANGGLYLDDELLEEIDMPDRMLQELIDEQRARVMESQEIYRGGEAPLEIKNRVVILVDDGLATGSTLIAAVRSIRAANPRKLVVAVPVGSDHGCELIEYEADELVCFEQPRAFFAVGFFYADFDPVGTDEVVEILHDYGAERGRE